MEYSEVTYVGVGLHLVQDSGSAALGRETFQAAVLVVGTTEHGPNHRMEC